MATKNAVTRVGGTDLAAIAPALEEAKKFALAGVPANTQRAYRADWDDFSAWCSEHRCQPMPADPRTLVAYLADQAKSYKTSTIQRRLSAIAKAHSVKGHPNPCSTEPVRATLRGIAATLGSRPEGKAPVTHDALTKMIAAYAGRSDNEALRARAVLLVGFAGAFRRSELCALKTTDLTWSPQGVVILVRKSKTDQRGEGHQKAIPYVGGPLCAATALAAWVKACGGNGPVFRSLDRYRKVTDRPLTTQSVALIVKGAADKAGIDPATVSGHSLRAGHVTEARARGVADAATMQTTGHRRVETLEMYDRRNNPFQKGSAADVLRSRE